MNFVNSFSPNTSTEEEVQNKFKEHKQVPMNRFSIFFFCVHIHVDSFTYSWNWPEVLDFEHICSNVFAFVFNGRIYSNRNRTDKQKPDTAAKLSFTLKWFMCGFGGVDFCKFWYSIRQVGTFPTTTCSIYCIHGIYRIRLKCLWIFGLCPNRPSTPLKKYLENRTLED